MSEDQVRRMDLGDVVLTIDAHMPIRARRLVYHEDPVLKSIFAAQTGELPYPSPLPAPGPAVPAPSAPEEVLPPGLRAPDDLAARPEPAPRPVEAEPAFAEVAPPAAPLRLMASARRAAVAEAQTVLAIQPLEAVVKAEDAAVLRAAVRRIETLLANPDAGRRTRPARSKARKLVVSARRASIGQAKPAIFIQPVDLVATPEDEAALQRANTHVIRLQDLLSDEAADTSSSPDRPEP